MHDTSLAIGHRIEQEGFYATVRYIGELETTETNKPHEDPACGKRKVIWAGVEWDDPSRGKHDGTYKGVRYFGTSHPTSGSFLRADKINPGTPFMSALVVRYGSEVGVDYFKDSYVLGKNLQHTVINVIGAEKLYQQQSQLNRLLEVSLREMGISHAGADGEIAANASNIRDLDLTRNLLSSWTEVARITSQLNHLTILKLCENRIQPPDTTTESRLRGAFDSVKSLSLNRTLYDWPAVLKCTSLFPSLVELHVCFNRIESLGAPPFDTLTLLNIEGNCLVDWTTVLELGNLQRLETLILNNTELVEISFPDDGNPTRFFVNVKSLSLSGNRIAEWSSINQLNRLASLTSLKILNNPIAATIGNSHARDVVIARIARLRFCNNMEVDRGQRRGAELDYLKMAGLEWKASGGNFDSALNRPSAEFCRQHPRYQDLVDVYGAVEDSEMKKTTSALKNNLIAVKIVGLTGPTKAPVSKKLPASMTVLKLKNMLRRMYGTGDASRIQITYVSHRVVGPPINLEFDQRELGYYSIEDGDTIQAQW